MLLLIHKGLIWLLVAIIAEVPPVVSGSILVPILSIHCEFMCQVFICLNLNGILSFLLYILLTKNIDDWTRIFSEYKLRSTTCVLVRYSCGVVMEFNASWNYRCSRFP